MICPRTNSSSLTTSKLKDEEPKICEFGAFQDYRMKIATTEMVFLDQEKKHVLVNRTWLELPNLQIPVHSDTYCVRWNNIFSMIENFYFHHTKVLHCYYLSFIPTGR